MFLDTIKIIAQVEGVIDEQFDFAADLGCGVDEMMLYFLFGSLCVCNDKGGEGADGGYDSAR